MRKFKKKNQNNFLNQQKGGYSLRHIFRILNLHISVLKVYHRCYYLDIQICFLQLDYPPENPPSVYFCSHANPLDLKLGFNRRFLPSAGESLQMFLWMLCSSTEPELHDAFHWRNHHSTFSTRRSDKGPPGRPHLESEETMYTPKLCTKLNQIRKLVGEWCRAL